MHIALLSIPGNFHCQKWAHALQQAGARVSIYSLEAAQVPGLRSVHIRPAYSWRGRYRFPSYGHSARRLRAALEQDRVELVQALHLTPFGWWGLQAGHRPLVASALGADVLEYVPGAPALGYNASRPGGWLQRHKRAYYRRIVQQVLARADLLTADNQHLARQLQQHFGVAAQRVMLLPWGVASAIRRPDASLLPALYARLGLQPGHPLILAPRGANGFYQADVILHAFEQILQGPSGSYGHQLVLLSAGYAVGADIRRQAHRLMQRYPAFRFYEGQLSAAEMGALWSQTTAFISAPLYDGYSATVAEGRTVGAIPLVSDLPAYREELIPDETGLFIAPFTPSRLAATLAEVLARTQDGPAAYARLRQRNQAWAEEHADILPGARRFLDSCQQLVAAHQRTARH